LLTAAATCIIPLSSDYIIDLIRIALETPLSDFSVQVVEETQKADRVFACAFSMCGLVVSDFPQGQYDPLKLVNKTKINIDRELDRR